MEHEAVRAVLGKSIAEKLGDEPLAVIRATCVSDLVGTYRLTPSQAKKVTLLRGLSKHLVAEPLKRGARFMSSADINRHFRGSLGELLHEEFHAVLLDGKHRIIGTLLISRGTLTSAPVHPREVFRPAIERAAAAIIVVHNHPSGDPAPSADDLEITRRLADVGELVGIRVLDHIIIGDGEYCSLADRGLMR